MALSVSSADTHPMNPEHSGKMLTAASAHFHFCHYNKKHYKSGIQRKTLAYRLHSRTQIGCVSHGAHCHNNTIKIS